MGGRALLTARAGCQTALRCGLQGVGPSKLCLPPLWVRSLRTRAKLRGSRGIEDDMGERAGHAVAIGFRLR